jgi:anti-sigma factor RsiW
VTAVAGPLCDVSAAVEHVQGLPAGPDRDRFCGWLLAALVDRVAELEEIATAARELMAGLADEKVPLTELGVVLARLADALGERRR